MNKPLAIDLFCGLGGWTEGLLDAGYYVIGFDVERHEYGADKYPAQLVLQDVLTLHGSQFKDAALIVASPPCQEYSYMAMPWSLAKEKAFAYWAGWRDVADLTALFDACFRIQREACEAAGRHIPLVVENVRGAIPWVGRSRWNYGSFHLWGDVPALMPMTKAVKLGGGASWYPPTDPRHQPGLDFTRLAGMKCNPDGTDHPPGSWFAIADSKNRGARSGGQKVPGFRFDGSGKSFQTASVRVTKNGGSDEISCLPGSGLPTDSPIGSIGHGLLSEMGSATEGIKQHGSGREWFAGEGKISRVTSSHSKGRKAASAKIAKIPLPLSSYIARVFFPTEIENVV